ncbi:unnamed protein product, partial [marine sediment metagenome]
PKLSCAERIVLARIMHVYVGVEDPDPKVDRKGIRYLQDNGVEVKMFDRDLQEVIKEENKACFDQALERAAEEEEKAKEVTLSRFESFVQATATEDLMAEALEKYRTAAGIKEAIGTPEFYRRLVLHGLLKKSNGRFAPTGFGLLLFGRNPRDKMPQAGLLGTIHYANGQEDTRDFDG